ncbi:MAG TPA: TlpA disulfide reductase family protein [Methylomirabilota bacterium]|nr:TlpA disulfide reductase family protein [Methylomirabilota bacterium]
MRSRRPPPAGGRPVRLSGRRGWIVGALFVVAMWDPAGADPSVPASLLKPLNLVSYPVGTRPPPFSGRTLDAQPLSLSELRGKVIVVNFWASWCLECRPEMPLLERLHREFAPRGLAIVGINAREDGNAVGRYARELGLSFPLLLDPGGKVNDLYGVVGIPTTFVIGRDGRAVAFAVGPREWTSPPARALIERLLAEPAPPRQ